MINSKLKDLKCYVFPGHVRDCKPDFLEYYHLSYSFWREFMGIEMRSENLEDIESKLSSDSFMLFEDIYALFVQDEIIGFFCFDSKDVRSQAILDQNYFKTYPKEILTNYILTVDKIMTIGHLLVHPEWRRSKIGIGLSDILVWFMHKRFLDSGCDLMIYWTRNNRSTNQLGIKFGGTPILENCKYGGLGADLIATWPDKVIMDCGDEEVNSLGQNLWQNRIFARHDDSPEVRRRFSPG